MGRIFNTKDELLDTGFSGADAQKDLRVAKDPIPTQFLFLLADMAVGFKKFEFCERLVFRDGRAVVSTPEITALFQLKSL